MITEEKMVYIPNNIELRMISSKCISNYKQAQAEAISQLVHTNLHTFSVTAKEILLLKYDIWFRWILGVEEMIRVCTRKELLAQEIISFSSTLEKEYINIMRTNPHIFDQYYVDIWLKVHSYLYNYLKIKIEKETIKSISDFMVNITNTLIAVMQNTLFELHELDNVIYNTEETVFVSFDDICIDFVEVLGEEQCLLLERLNIYKELRHFNSVILKDYSSGNKLLNGTSIKPLIVSKVLDNGFIIEDII